MNSKDTRLLHPGSSACNGCGSLLALRWVLEELGERTMVVNATGCMTVAMRRGIPRVPFVHTLFGNAAAVASGIATHLDGHDTKNGPPSNEARPTVLCLAGDGATADIGLGALSGMVARGHRVMYLCLDNERYMNTGGQPSGTTPPWATTRTSPGSGNNMRYRHGPKDVALMLMAQGIGYAATASIARRDDLLMKVRQASEHSGPSFISVNCPCPPGWSFPSERTLEVARWGVEAGLVPLYHTEGCGLVIDDYPESSPELIERYLTSHGHQSVAWETSRGPHPRIEGPSDGDIVDLGMIQDWSANRRAMILRHRVE